jgi:hypothetical protein
MWTGEFDVLVLCGFLQFAWLCETWNYITFKKKYDSTLSQIRQIPRSRDIRGSGEGSLPKVDAGYISI